MQKHTEIYFNAFGYDLSDPDQFIPSEISRGKAVDIHHITGRGKGGEDRIENLMAVTRKEHDKYGDKKKWMLDLLFLHESQLKIKKIEYEKSWFVEKYRMYST